MNARLANFARAEALLLVAAQSPELTDKIDRLREEIARATRPAPVPTVQRPVPHGRR
jgi:hypothetical protein